MSTSVQPQFGKVGHLLHGDAEGRQDDDVVGTELAVALGGIAEEPDAARAEPVVDVRVVDDLAGEEDVASGEPRHRLVGVVDGAVDAVAEAEFPGQVDGEPSLFVPVVAGADFVDEGAVVRGGQLTRDGLFHVEALAEDEGLRAHRFRVM